MKKIASGFVMLVHPLQKINFAKAEHKTIVAPALAAQKQRLDNTWLTHWGSNT